MANRANLSALFVALLAKANIFDIYVYKHTYLSKFVKLAKILSIASKNANY